MAHTPGPWTFGVVHTIDDGGDGMFEVEAEAMGVRNRAGDFGRPFIIHGASDDDARLIVAAPDLLDIARNVAGFDDGLLKSADLNLIRATLREWRDEARAAIRRATERKI